MEIVGGGYGGKGGNELRREFQAALTGRPAFLRITRR